MCKLQLRTILKIKECSLWFFQRNLSLLYNLSFKVHLLLNLKSCKWQDTQNLIQIICNNLVAVDFPKSLVTSSGVFPVFSLFYLIDFLKHGTVIGSVYNSSYFERDEISIVEMFFLCALSEVIYSTTF